MRRRRASHKNSGQEDSGMAFLDVIACGFGAMVVLLLVTRPLPVETGGPDAPAVPVELEQAREMVQRWQALLAAAIAAGASEPQTDVGAALQAAEGQLEELKRDNRGLEQARESLQRAAIRAKTPVEQRDPEVGGIPVDSEYVIFIVDTSGSMQAIWDRVMDTMTGVLDIHPRMRGFQVMDDQGGYLIGAYAKKWIPDTPGRRNSILGVLRQWSAFSNSSPVEGLETALRSYAKRREKVAIYVFGDDFTGSSYDSVLETLQRLNYDPIAQRNRVRVHAIGFVSEHSTERYATLMREVTRANDGTFLALPIEDGRGRVGVARPDYRSGVLRRPQP